MIKQIADRTGIWFFPLGFIARFPFAMMVVGVLTLVVSVRGSVMLGGINSALVGTGTAIFGPIIGSLADRTGQRKTLLIVGLLNAFFLALFVWLVWSPLPDWVMLAGAFMIGATAPQVSSMSRSRMIGIIGSDIPVSSRDRALGTAMAYESTVDEIVFVFGPFVVGVLAVSLGAGSPILAAAVMTAVFVTWFALHRTAAPRNEQARERITPAPIKQVFRPDLLVVIAGIFGMGLFFGSMLTSLTAFMQFLGSPERTGVLYGFMGLGSAILALSVAFFSPRFSKRYRWLAFALVMLGGGIYLQFVTDELTMFLALGLIGFGVGPILVTQYSFGADRSPLGRDVTVMTTLSSAIVVGQSLSSALVGWFSESFGAHASLFLPLLAVVWILLCAVINWFITPSGLELSKRQSEIS